ncbi:MAG: Smr/MutS family protein [Chloroflexota bacterium]|nr:Smr/MutS family protein [Chloroflexota bacterium]
MRRKKSPRRTLIYEVDLHGMTWDEAERRLRAAPREAARRKSRILKIIHGWGRTTGSSVLQERVRSWLARSPFSFRAVIPGEAYTIYNEQTVQMRDEIGQFPDTDLNADNAGVTIVWLR